MQHPSTVIFLGDLRDSLIKNIASYQEDNRHICQQPQRSIIEKLNNVFN